MNSIENLYQNALLSDAAYLDWSNRALDSEEFAVFRQDMISLLQGDNASTEEGRRLTSSEALGFVDRYVSEDNRPIQFIDNSTGFAATLFYDEETNKQILAIRGTEFTSEDFTTDILIGLLGEASDQFASLKTFISQLQSDPDVTLDDLTVTGHSLGGHLATLMTLDEELGPLVEQAFTYNGAGLSTVPVPILGTTVIPTLLDFFGIETGDEAAVNKITNVFSTTGAEVVAGFAQTFGETIGVFTENQGNGFNAVGNHFIEHLTNSLSVYRILDRLDPIQSEDDFQRVHDILSGASPEPTESLQSVIDDLGALFGINPDNRDKEKTEEFFEELKTIIDGFPEGTSFRVRSLVDANSGVSDIEDIFAPALAEADGASNIAYRYALEQLDPFVVEVLDAAGAVDEAATLALFEPHNEGGRLERANFSEAFLADRSRLLFEKLRAGLADVPKDIDGVFQAEQGAPLLINHYEDLSTNFALDVLPDIAGFNPFENQNLFVENTVFGSDADEQGTNALIGDGQEDSLYGRGGDDELIGDEGADLLEGNAGDDTLWGGTQGEPDDGVQDTLRGGAGNDTYHIGLNDIIEDSDGRGRLFLPDGTEVSGRVFKLTQDNIYESQDGERLRLRFEPATGALAFLGEPAFTIRDFQDGDFNITLDGGTGNDTLYGDGGNDDLIGGTGRDTLARGTDNEIIHMYQRAA